MSHKKGRTGAIFHISEFANRLYDEISKRREKRRRYKEYIRSPEWKQKADEAKERAGHRCQLCNAKGILHAHHRTYERLGEELPMDITVLCSEHHAKFHDIIT